MDTYMYQYLKTNVMSNAMQEVTKIPPVIYIVPTEVSESLL